MDSQQAAAAAGLFDFVLAEITQIFYSTEWKALVIVPKVTGSISFLASAFVARDIIVKSDNNNNNKKTSLPNRIVFFLSVADMMRSFFMDFIGTWMVPTGVSYGSAGSIRSCTIQGFLVNFFGTSAYLYNTSLAVCYVLIICYGFRGQKLETTACTFLLIPALIALVFAIPPLFSDSYNYTGGWSCNIAPAPILCDDPNVPYPCKRGGVPDGAIALNLQLWTLIVPSFSCGILILLFMLLLFLETWKRNRASGQYADFQRSRRNQGQSLRVAVQGIFYALAYFLSVIFYYILHIMMFVGDNRDPPYWLHMLNAIFLPLQGLFNAFVYLRPRYLRKYDSASGMEGVAGTSLSVCNSNQLQTELGGSSDDATPPPEDPEEGREGERLEDADSTTQPNYATTDIPTNEEDCVVNCSNR